VRRAVAQKDHLGETAFNVLAADGEAQFLRVLVPNDKAKTYLSAE
jgi:hypothetical protein